MNASVGYLPAVFCLIEEYVSVISMQFSVRICDVTAQNQALVTDCHLPQIQI